MIRKADDERLIKYGILEEGEIFYQSSDPIIYSTYSSPVLIGPALVSRPPTVLPSDIQKVIGVYVPQFAHLADTLVFSSKGKRPGCSLLSGGDYDGDTIRLITERELVEPFVNSEAGFADPPFADKDWFEMDRGKVGDITEWLEEGREGDLAGMMIRSLYQSSRFGRR